MLELERDMDKIFDRVEALEKTVIETMRNLIHLQEIVISLQDSFSTVVKSRLDIPEDSL